MDRNSKNAWKNHSCTQGTVDLRLINEKGGFSFFCDAESLGKYSEAEPLYMRSLEIYESQLGADHPDVALSLNNLAALYDSQGKYSEAEPLYLRSLEIFMQALGQDHSHTQTAMTSLMMLRLQMSTGMSSETLQQMITENPDNIIRFLQDTNPDN